MAEYITVNRWITGVATHKTKRGRILCTGLGCVGCFPQDFPEIACELEVYDCKTGLLFAESWTNINDLGNKSAIETRRQRIKLAKRKHRSKRETLHTELKTCENLNAKEAVNSDKSTAAEKTRSGKFKNLFLTEYAEESEETNRKETEKLPTALKYTSKRTEFLPSTEPKKDDRFRVVYREDCVCLFFALEYNHNSRRLSDFSILEIVGSLTTIMHVNQIKYVQRLNGLWHIVLRTREHLRYLLTTGLKIRGRWYRVIQDNNMYCEKVY